jgi:hypothetical protein
MVIAKLANQIVLPALVELYARLVQLDMFYKVQFANLHVMLDFITVRDNVEIAQKVVVYAQPPINAHHAPRHLYCNLPHVFLVVLMAYTLITEAVTNVLKIQSHVLDPLML